MLVPPTRPLTHSLACCQVYQKQPYGVLSDAYSVGVALLEFCKGKKLPAAKDKQAQKQVG